jgi:hypothetical protein
LFLKFFAKLFAQSLFLNFLSNFWKIFCFRTFVKLYSILSFLSNFWQKFCFQTFSIKVLSILSKKVKLLLQIPVKSFSSQNFFSHNYFAIHIFTLFCLYIFLPKLLMYRVEHESTYTGPRWLVGGSTASCDPCGRPQTWVAPRGSGDAILLRQRRRRPASAC